MSLVDPNPLNPRYNSPTIKSLVTGEDKPNPIHLCVVCRSKDISQETHLFWFWKRWRFVCNECGTTLQQVGSRYMLACVPDTESSIWRKYGQKILRSGEWANIANGGFSDDELTANFAKWQAAARRR
jgi:hypothetical protein